MLKFKFLISSLILIVIFTTYGFTQSLEKELVKADSLYEKKQYLSAVKIYDKIFQEGHSSPAMLLKLAKIEEGMGNLGQSMFYLEKYYQLTKDENALNYLEDTTDEIAAIGFDYGLIYKADLFYKEWKLYFQLFFSIVIFLGLGLMIKNHNSTPKKNNYFAMAIIPILIVAFLNNYNGKSDAIVTITPSYLLEGPSSGANLVEKVNTPAKIQVKNQIDVWSKVIFEEKEAYIKTSQIKRL
ncbi:MAG: tetratricopeptide repeat protein [Bacteroidota bacterium]